MEDFDKLKSIVANVFDCDVDEIDEKTDLTKLINYDSLNHINLIMEVENIFSQNIPIEMIDSIKTLDDLRKILNL
jgi:acyl carrier protein